MADKEDEMKDRLDELTDMINRVYLPLCESKPDQRLHMDKFVRQVKISMQQAYGNITIQVPELPENESTEQLCNDKALINDLINTIQQWEVTIKDTIDRENGRAKESKSAQGETEYWRQRSATFNTLYQQLNMPQVKKIINVMQMNNEKPDGYSLDSYNTAYNNFQKQHAQAKDFVKFLNTLYRQFKNIHMGELQTIEETLPSLLTGLKLIWTISRHINQNESKMEDILEAISNEICDKVKAQIDVTKIFKKKPEVAIKIIKQGMSVLEKWKKEYDATKRDIEQQQTVKRWDFTRQKEIFEQSIHMREVLKDLEQACIITQEFYAILGPDLKAVTGDASSIDAETEKVKEQVKKLEGVYHDVFSKQHEVNWKNRFAEFNTQISQIDQHVVQLIEKTFADKLNSSEGAFNLLAKFQNIKTRAAIKDLLNKKYDAVLVRYGKELTIMKDLFENNRDKPPISKNMPPKAGSIAWARSIMGRIKAPIKKFKSKSDQLMSKQFSKVAHEYVALAKDLDQNYEQEIFNKWKDKNTDEAIKLLNKFILQKEIDKVNDNCIYRVNFAPELKVIIREAKFLDRIGKPIPQTIINIALQEKDYMRHVDKLNQLLRGYNSALNNLKPVEKKLMQTDIKKLQRHMDKGVKNHNWFSLSIDEYIKECQMAIDTFKETKNIVLQHAQNIEKKVVNIENAQIVRQIEFDRKNPMDITEFSDYFESYRVKILAELVKDYENIGDQYLKSIEECTVKNNAGADNSKASEEMKHYYMYWERRIFNAITKMIVRALAANKTIYMRTERPCLIKMISSYNHPEITFHPTTDELRTQLEKFSRNILESTKSFGRWWNGYCKIFEERVNEENAEKYIPYTFFDDVMQNKMISQLHFEIVQCKNQIIQRFDLLMKGWTKRGQFKYLFDKNEMTKLQKSIDKSQSTQEIEQKILIFKRYRYVNLKQDNEHENYFVLIDNSEVKESTISKVDEWLQILGDSLKVIAIKEWKAIKNDIDNYEKALGGEMGAIDQLKALLNVITEIKNISMDMEFRIVEVQEQFRVLDMYEYEFDEEIKKDVQGLMNQWEQLLEYADKTNFGVNDFKKNFAEVTKQDVETFKIKILDEYNEYIAKGPGVSSITLEEGVELLTQSKEKIKAFNKTREENVLAEKLFNLPISKFPELIQMEEANKKYDQVYNIYKDHMNSLKEFSVMSWSKLDVSQLEASAQKFVTTVRKLTSKFPGVYETMHPFIKTKEAIEGFQNSLPLIVQLKNPAIQERHWKRIMEETGKDLGDINLKTLTLSKVFELELQNFEDKVMDICIEAKEEAKNEENINKIDQAWKTTNFDIVLYKKGTEVKGYAMKAPDEIRQILEDNILILQSLSASKYIRNIKPKVTQWERDLNIINDTIDAWMLVQRKWMYLESIFASDDIKMQLPEEAKKFGKTDAAYKKIMEAAYKQPNVLQACVKADGGNRLSDLKNISFDLDKCQKSLTNYLESKQMSFPRFYFISNDDLLQILGSSDPKSIQGFLLSLFDNCKKLDFGKGDKQMIGMTSDEGEQYEFFTPIKPEGNVEDWMNKVDEEMKSSLQTITKIAVFNYAKSDRIEWIREQIGMVALVGTQIWWTFAVEDVFRRVASGDKHAMKNELAKEIGEVNDLIALVRTDLPSNIRKCVNTLIILDVHAKDIVDRFVRDSILSAKEFDWESQLRFYWEQEKDDINIRQCTGQFDYCYEYQGLNGRLVITPLTDRCVMTLTTALTFKLGGAPAGPAGTGKTETVKDLAKGLALRCVVTNCGETLDNVAMGIIFSGLIQTGFWGCFDEFNRINLEVLSVISTQIKVIQNGLLFEKKKIDFQGTDMRLISSIGIYITMNPGYAGRSELPDNLKALFRPVTMVVPDLLLICANMLMSEGFTQAQVLAKKMTTLYKLSKEQLSKQYHYDFGLRALKSVLVMAGQLKRQYSDLPEDIVLMRALRDMNMPKFVFEDVPLFQGLINDLFPGIKADRVGYESLNGHIIDYLEKQGNKHSDEEIFFKQVDKVVQLYETMQTRHTTMVVGPTGAGKSVIIDTLAHALKDFLGSTTSIYTINPKMITLNELYGVLDPDSRDWTDGLLSKIFKDINVDLAPGKKEQRWILYDGDVDAVWVENMNSVMDDNRILTLANGDRIRLLKHCAMLFEVFDLQYASPATISRCGMVFVDAKNLGYAPFYERWTNQKKNKYGEIMAESLKELYTKYVYQCIERIFEGNDGSEELLPPMQFITPRTNLNLVQQLCTLVDSMLPDQEAPEEFDQLEKFYIFCLIWSFGGALVEEDREKFSEFIRNTSQLILPSSSLYDTFFNIENLTFMRWEEKVPAYEAPHDKKFSSILVPTVDTVRYAWLLNQVMSLKKPALFCGDSGTAKTVTVQSCFRNLDADKFLILNINFSSRTTSLDFQKIIEENIDKRTFKQYGPKASGKRMVIFIDDMNMPKIDTYGTQQPLALGLFLMGRQLLYQRGGDLELREIVDTQFVGCTTPAGAGNNRVDPRVMTLFSVFNITSPSREATEKIYTQILEKHCLEFADDIQAAVPKITQATMNLYFAVIEKLPRTPVKFHYIFNLRDLSRIYEGLLQSTVDKFTDKQSFIRLWRNESMRVFCDRLIDQTDSDIINGVISDLTKEFFKDVDEYVLRDPIIFGDYSMANPTDDEAEDPRLYEDLGEIQFIKDKLDKMLEDYSFDHKPMSLVLFNDALLHVTKIHRIIRFPKGCGLLVGFGGSGKQSLTRLATFTACYDVFTISLIRGYKESDFREDLRNLYKLVLGKPQTFMFTDSHVAEEGFLELINNILTIGMVPALFPEEEKDGLIGPLDDEMRKQKLPETKEFRWNYFVNKCRENLHIVLAMSPAGDTLRVRCRNFPGLISNTNVDWFFPWPEDALTAVANNFMGAVDLEDEQREKVTQHLVMVHLSVQKFSLDFKTIYKRNNFSTPKNYLDFIQNYIKFLGDKRKQCDNNVSRLEGGLTTLAKAQQDTEALSKELAAANVIIGEKKIVVAELIADITQKSEVAAVQQKGASEKREALEKQGVIIAREEQIASKALEEAIPALTAAKEALKNIDQKALTEIKALANPPSVIEQVCGIALYLYPKSGNDASWATIKVQLLGDMQLLRNLQEYEVAKTKADGANRAKKKMAALIKELDVGEGPELVALISSKNQATGGMFRWCDATLKCYDIYKKVEPLKQNAKKMALAKEQGEKELAETEATLAALNASLAELNSNKKIKQDELDELERKSNEMTRKLNAASQLINGLGSEQVRWTGDMGLIKEDKIRLVGDCLTGSAFLSYCGPFNSVLRQKMIFETWKQDLLEKELPNKEDFRLDIFLTDEVQVAKWASEGLPTDELSVQNGILTTSASRWPLCIDPQMQAVTWIKEKEKKNPFEILTFNMGDYIKRLEMAIKFGKSVLFEGIDEEIDPMIDPVLEKNIVKEAGVNMLTLGDQKMEYHDDFRLFLTTKISNPNYTPEIFGKTMIINFSVTQLGLRDQLLNEVVEFERPELEEARKNLIIETSQNKATLKMLEDTLLSELSKESDIPLVDNVPLIDTLNTAKTKSVEIGQALEVAKETNADIERNRESYKEVAWRGAILFFSIAGLSNIVEMYEYSLSSYMTVFMNALSTSRKDNILQNRLRNIKEKLTMLVYDFTCMGIFEKHKLMYSFQMITMIMDGDDALNKIEFDFFLKGNTSLDAVEAKKPFDFLSENGWKDIQKLETLGDAWTGFIDNLVKNKVAWKEWYDLESPEQSEIPCGYTQKLSKFQILLLMRVLRPDRVVNAIKNFIIDKMNDYYVKSPPISFQKIYESSACKTPIVFILSPGADPFADVQKLVETVGLGMNKFRFLALGQGMEDQARQYIEGGAMRGHWVMLQNCHLLASWLKKLEIIYDGITKPDKAFRLWLTTAPTDKFPLGILQKSLKVVTEPPDGLGQNIKQTYSKLSDEVFDECPKEEFKPMLYVLSFFHAVIQERKKFGKIGWNVSYDFNMSDYLISYQLISLYLNKAHQTGDEDLPWDTLRYLIGQAMYGGRVTDDNDRRVLTTYLEEYLGNFIFDTNQKFFFSRTGCDYVVPAEENFELTLEFIDNISLFTSPGVFGLHSNAEIQYYTSAAKELWLNIIELQTSDGGGSGGINREDLITQIADDIQSKLPELFDEYNIRKSFDIPSPTQVVLLQELERMNKLIGKMHSSISDLKRALNGEIGMSQDLDVLGSSFFNGFLPPMWAKLAPQTQKNLVNWMTHYERRFKQYRDWIDIEEPKVIWLSGLHIPESYLTALIQTTCRSKGWALDKSTMYTQVTKIHDMKEVTKRLDQGTYVQGLYIEGARWNSDRDCLDNQNPKELVTMMPLVQIIPVEANKIKLRGTIKTPVYITQLRRNAMGVGLVCEADLKTQQHVSHWILQGVALMLNID